MIDVKKIDGASLECCRILRSKNQEDIDIYEYLNLGKLVDKYVKLSTGREDFEQAKTMKQEYQEIKEIEKLHIKTLEPCDENAGTASNKSISNEEVSYYPLTCSLDDSFEIHTSLLNNLNLYP